MRKEVSCKKAGHEVNVLPVSELARTKRRNSRVRQLNHRGIAKSGFNRHQSQISAGKGFIRKPWSCVAQPKLPGKFCFELGLHPLQVLGGA